LSVTLCRSLRRFPQDPFQLCSLLHPRPLIARRNGRYGDQALGFELEPNLEMVAAAGRLNILGTVRLQKVDGVPQQRMPQWSQ
jgi:hypothetical protein